VQHALLRCGFQMRQDFFGVAFWFYLFVDVLDFSSGADDEGHAGDTHVLLAIHAFFLDYAKGFADFFIDIGQQRKR
jgi:hypothetical protein